MSVPDEVAHAAGIAVGGVERSSTVDDYAEVELEPAELADPPVDLGDAGAQEVEHASAWGCAVVTQGDDAAVLAERQPDGLGGADEREFDAVGIPAALEIHATARTDCPTCGRGLRVEI